MTERELNALLAIEGSVARVWEYASGLWIAEINGKSQSYPIGYAVGEDEKTALANLISRYYYGNDPS